MLNVGEVRAMNHVHLHHQVLVDELSPVRVVGVNSADASRGHDDEIRPLRSQKVEVLSTFIPTLNGGVNHGSVLYVFGKISIE